VEIPFKDTRYTMLLLLPVKREGVRNMIKDLQHKSLSDICSQLRKVEVDLVLPRFTIEYSNSLAKILQTMDIQDVFSKTANLTGILDSKIPIAVKDIIHKAKIEVNEEGAKAAGSTMVQVVTLMATSTVPFIANRPFVFVILDKQTGYSLFEGVLAAPDLAKEPLDPTTSAPGASSVYLRDAQKFITQVNTSVYQEPYPVDKDGVKFRKNSTFPSYPYQAQRIVISG